MAEFETLKSEVRDFGAIGFIAVERKRVQATGKKPNEFLMVARGYYLKDGTAKRRSYVTVPDHPEVRAFVAKMLQEL